MQYITIYLGCWFAFFSVLKVCAWCERRFELHIWARMNVHESVQMCIYERVGVPGWPVSRTQQLCYRYPPLTESTPVLVNQLIWSELLALYDCLSQHWQVVLVTMLASTGLTVKQRVTLRRNGRDVEVSSFFSSWGLILTLMMLRSRAVWTSGRPRETQSLASCVCSRRRRWTPCWRNPFWNAHIGQKQKHEYFFELAYVACG